MDTYTASQSNNNDEQSAKNIILQTLLPLGFVVTGESPFSLAVQGPGYRSTRQSPLLGISQADFEFSRSAVSVKAQLGGVDRLAYILAAVVLGVGLFDSAIFFALWYFMDTLRGQVWFLTIPALTLLPWIVIAPLIIRFLRRNCHSAIDRLLRNAGGQYS